MAPWPTVAAASLHSQAMAFSVDTCPPELTVGACSRYLAAAICVNNTVRCDPLYMGDRHMEKRCAHCARVVPHSVLHMGALVCDALELRRRKECEIFGVKNGSKAVGSINQKHAPSLYPSTGRGNPLTPGSQIKPKPQSTGRGAVTHTPPTMLPSSTGAIQLVPKTEVPHRPEA